MVTQLQLRTQHLTRSSLLKMEDAKRFVHPTDLWYAYDVNEIDSNDLSVVIAELEHEGVKIRTSLIMYNDYVLSASHCDINDVLAAIQGTKYKLPKVHKFGYIDEVDRRKYVSVPVKGYWDLRGYPIVMIK